MGDDASFVVLAPHCDDETLAASGLLTMAASQGVPATVVMMTNGDGFNRYALGSQHRRLRPTPEQYIAFAYRRQEETIGAVEQMGLRAEDVVFLGYPDRGLAAMWGEHWSRERPYRSRSILVDHTPYHNSLTPGTPFSGRALVDDLKEVFRRARPTHVITSHPHDAHGDHWATYCFALYALDELMREGEEFAGSAQILAYLTHRGRWPRPAGYRPGLTLNPPRQYEHLPFPWVTIELPPDAVVTKHRALLAYQSQLRYMRQYLMSFVRRNELFGLFTALHVPHRRRPRPEPVAVGGLPEERQAGTAARGAPGRSGVWSGPACEVLDPVPPSWAGRVRRAADIQSVQATRDDEHLFLRMYLRSRASRDLNYCVTFYGVGRPGSHSVRNRLDVEVKIPDRVMIRTEGEWEGHARRVTARVENRELELAIPLALLAHSDRVFVGVQTRYGRFVLDQVAWHMLVLADEADAEEPDVEPLSGSIHWESSPAASMWGGPSGSAS